MVAIDLFSREQTTPPTVTLSVRVGLVALAASIVLICYRYRDRVATRWILRVLQVSQLSPYFQLYPDKANNIRTYQFSWTPLESTQLDELVRPYI
mgnify:FL=1